MGFGAVLTTLGDGLGFAEGLRWHDGKLWFSDFVTRRVQTLDLAGTLTEVGFVPGVPSGLGFTADGPPLVVSMLDRRLLAIGDGTLSVVADLRGLATFPANDMLVRPDGQAWISTMTHELWYEPLPARPLAPLLGVSPSGQVRVAAPDMAMANGIALLPDGKTLVVAETHGRRLTAFDVAGDGSLRRRRLFADLGDIHPDGICADANGDIWVGGLYAESFLHVREGGEVLDRIAVPGCWAVTCVLGGSDGRRLFCAVKPVTTPTDMRTGHSRSLIHWVDVAVPAAA